MKYLALVFYGMLIGIAELIPGVGGAIVALIVGIYDDFIQLLHSMTHLGEQTVRFVFSFRWRERAELQKTWRAVDWKFFICIAVGVLITVPIFTGVISFILDNYASYLFALMFGIILASIAIPFSQIEKKGIMEAVITVVTFVLVFLLLGQGAAEVDDNSNVLVLFLVGIVVAMAIALPGISASFLLVLFGVYSFIINFIHAFFKLDIQLGQVLNIMVFGLGIVVGLMLSSRLLKWALSYHRSQMMAVLVGFMAASLRPLFPFDDRPLLDQQLPLKLALIIIGILGIFALQRLSRRELEKA